MRARNVVAVGVLVLASLAVVSLAGASSSTSPFKRYTFPAAPPAKVASPGTLAVSLPSGWSVKTEWPPSATGQGLMWLLGADLRPKGTTLADIRAGITWSGCRKGWGYERQVADTYLTLPVGRVWLSTWRNYGNDKNCKSAVFDDQRYWLDRKMVSRDGRQVFLEIDASCRANQCRAHNGQLTAIMRSIRITP